MAEAARCSSARRRAREAVLHDAAPTARGAILRRLLGPMDRKVALSFTDEQIRELERVLAAAPVRRLPIDIRVTVPLFGRGFFITVLAGPERRSKARLEEERAKHALWTFANLCCFAFLLVLFVPTAIGFVHMLAAGL